jgi:hypothetical protein
MSSVFNGFSYYRYAFMLRRQLLHPFTVKANPASDSNANSSVSLDFSERQNSGFTSVFRNDDTEFDMESSSGLFSSSVTLTSALLNNPS